MVFHIGKLSLCFPHCYFAFVAAGQLAIRAMLNGLHAFELTHPPRSQPIYLEGVEGFWRNWWMAFLGTHPSEHVRDFWHPTIIGFIELALYPPLIAHGDFLAIGGWIGIKTAAQWPGWGKVRSIFNRFLIGNAFVIVAACYLATLIKIGQG